MMLLGAGMNGHLGLNEPGTSFDLYSHIVPLDETTKIVGQKYFSGKVAYRRDNIGDQIYTGIQNSHTSSLMVPGKPGL